VVLGFSWTCVIAMFATCPGGWQHANFAVLIQHLALAAAAVAVAAGQQQGLLAAQCSPSTTVRYATATSEYLQHLPSPLATFMSHTTLPDVLCARPVMQAKQPHRSSLCCV
jgi:hypothetical protein